MHPRHRVTRSRGKKIFGFWRSTDKNSAKDATAEIREHVLSKDCWCNPEVGYTPKKKSTC